MGIFSPWYACKDENQTFLVNDQESRKSLINKFPMVNIHLSIHCIFFEGYFEGYRSVSNTKVYPDDLQ